ncbi:hypothetical protein DCC85_20130 [Paenibacillus sp. CAA11]|uniref:hypothetical protein n=1 Tax=Paenibacillus sp. CAA11 TaxID=1532905 RepID=UPI000D39D914|nr:hypothetical protein [Paenibacillus sp. CAA11]AWB46241.1 hypothetical protein DCC85_20130 [Paenibacillus sp. CAA11]
MYQSLLEHYNRSHEEYLKEYNRRIHSYSSVKLPFLIKADSGEELLEAFYVNHAALDLLHDQIIHRSQIIKRLYKELPAPAFKAYSSTKLIEEVLGTLALAGVPSSPADILESIEQLEGYRVKPNRAGYFEIVQAYYQALDAKVYDIEEAVDVLIAIYHKFNFRHSALEHERDPGYTSRIMAYLNDYPAPVLYKIAVIHFFMSHSSSDRQGNDFVSRYFSSLHLIHELDSLTGIALSATMYKNKASYQESYVICGDARNHGELTFFCEMFFNMIYIAQQELLIDLKTKQKKLWKLQELLNQIEDEDGRAVTYILGQHYIYSAQGGGLPLKELTILLGKTAYFVRKASEDLLHTGWIEYVKRKPLELILTREMRGLLDEN